MAINLDKSFSKFEAPDYLKFYIIPFIIIALIGYIVGIYFVQRDIKKGGYKIKVFDPECVAKNRKSCSESLSNPNDINNCIKLKNDSLCSFKYSRTGSKVPIILYIILPFLIAIILSSIIYNTLLYIKNPRVAGGIFIFKTLFPDKN